VANSKSRAVKRNDAKSPATVEGEELFDDDDLEIYRCRPGSLMRTRRLILAAVKLWEIKRGFRD
jgi:hypothetical protein